MSLNFNQGLQPHVNAWVAEYKRAYEAGDTAGMETALRNLEAHADYMDDGVCNNSFSREDAYSEFDIKEIPAGTGGNNNVPPGGDELEDEEDDVKNPNGDEGSGDTKETGGGDGTGDTKETGGGDGTGDTKETGGGDGTGDGDETGDNTAGVKLFETYKAQLDEETLQLLEAAFAGEDGVWQDDEKATAAKFLEKHYGKEISESDKKSLLGNDELQAAAYENFEKGLDDTGRNLLRTNFAGEDGKWTKEEQAAAYEYVTKKYGNELTKEEQKALINDKELHANRFDYWWDTMKPEQQQRIMDKYNGGKPLTEDQKDRASRDLQVICGADDLNEDDKKKIMTDSRLDKDSKENIAPPEFEVGETGITADPKDKAGGDNGGGKEPKEKTDKEYAELFDNWESVIDPRTMYMLEVRFRGDDGKWQPEEKAAAGKFIESLCGDNELDGDDLNKLANSDELHKARFDKWYSQLDDSQKERVRNEYADGRDSFTDDEKIRASKDLEDITQSWDDIDNTDKEKISNDNKYLSDGAPPGSIVVDNKIVWSAKSDEKVETEDAYLEHSTVQVIDQDHYANVDNMLNYGIPEEASELFHRFDVDKSGYLDERELAGMDMYLRSRADHDTLGGAGVKISYDKSRWMGAGSKPNERLVEYCIENPNSKIRIDDPENWSDKDPLTY